MRIFFILTVVLCTLMALAAPERSQTEKRHFAKAHPCPATGAPVPSCEGYVIDHIVPICAGGPDVAANMQWQKLDISKLKDRIERASCLCIRRHGAAACPRVDWSGTAAAPGG